MGLTALVLGGMALSSAVGGSVVVHAHPLLTPGPLVFDGVTVVDVEHGRLIQGQRVVIVGNRIRTVGSVRTVRMPARARVVDARGKYLIPGLWDMHTHSMRQTNLFYPLFIANGVTGIRDAGSSVPLDTLILWRREILAGTRVGPPRQILSGQSIAGPIPGCQRSRLKESSQNCIADSADARHYVDSLKAAGADMIKPRHVGKAMYFVIAAEARRLGIPFGGHAERVTAIEASDSGASIVDHMAAVISSGQLGLPCYVGEKGVELTGIEDLEHPGEFASNSAIVGTKVSGEPCRLMEERFRHNGTWFMQNYSPSDRKAYARLPELTSAFWAGSLIHGNWLHDSASSGTPDTLHRNRQHIGLPILAGTDVGTGGIAEELPGFSLHWELANYVAVWMTPLEALQSATLNPAKLLHATDSLGTVTPGKLADIVLLDANPLEDITNTTTIRAVVANGRYFDRAALDQLLVEVRTEAKQTKQAP